MSGAEELGPCPKCGKSQGEVVDAGSGRFRYFVACGNCGFTTQVVRVRGVAVKLWNEAKPVASTAKRRAGRKRA